MIKTWIKHKILETSIEKLFSELSSNFTDRSNCAEVHITKLTQQHVGCKVKYIIHRFSGTNDKIYNCYGILDVFKINGVPYYVVKNFVSSDVNVGDNGYFLWSDDTVCLQLDVK